MGSDIDILRRDFLARQNDNYCSSPNELTKTLGRHAYLESKADTD